MLACKAFQIRLVEAVTELELDSDCTTDAVVIAIAKRFKGIKAIDLSCCCDLSDVSLVALALHCPELTSVCLSDTNFEDFGIMTLAQYCPGITSIQLGGCYALTDATLRTLGRYCKDLNSVDLNHDEEGNTNFTDAGLLDLVEGCPKLTLVQLGGCVACTNSSIIAIAARLPKLVTIVLGNFGCGVLSDAAVKALAKNCPALTSTDLSGCGKISDAAVLALAYRCPALTDINLSRCFKLTSKSTVALVKHCSRLTRIDISCTDMADKSVMALAAYCPELRLARFGGLNVTDAALIVLAKCCKKLKLVNLTDCTKLSHAALLALAGNCSELKYLSLGCNGSTNLVNTVNDATVLALATGCPDLAQVVGLFRCPQVTISIENTRLRAGLRAASQPLSFA
jgi:ribosomal protein L30E